MWLGKLTALDMIPLGWLGRKTSTQTIINIDKSGVVHLNDNWLIQDIGYKLFYDSSIYKRKV